MSKHLRLRNISYNINPFRGQKYSEDAIDLNGDGGIDEYEQMMANIQNSEPTTKTYFLVRGKSGDEKDKKLFFFKFQVEFGNSNKDRYISFQYYRATCNHYLDGETEVIHHFFSVMIIVILSFGMQI